MVSAASYASVAVIPILTLLVAPAPLRIQVVTGGHPYGTSFYKVFEDADDLRWEHAVSNHEAL